MKHARSSRQRYREFVRDYKERRLDDKTEAAQTNGEVPAPAAAPKKRIQRRAYLREYLRWLWPHRYSVGAVFLFALCVAGLEMIEPLFMRFIVDRVLLNAEL